MNKHLFLKEKITFLTFSMTCSQTLQCDTSLGLICQNNTSVNAAVWTNIGPIILDVVSRQSIIKIKYNLTIT